MSTVLSYAFIAFVALNVVAGVRDTKQRPGYRMLRHLRPRHVGWGLVSVVGTTTAYVALAQVPGLSWGWWQLLGGTGSVAAGQSDATSTGAAAIVPVLMVALLLVAIPPLAYAEERAFRSGSQRRTRSRRFAVALLFGLVHLIMGIPIAAALAVTVAGLVFTRSYLRGYHADRVDAFAGEDWWAKVARYQQAGVPIPEPVLREPGAVQESTLVHVVHNYVLVSLIALALIAG